MGVGREQRQDDVPKRKRTDAERGQRDDRVARRDPRRAACLVRLFLPELLRDEAPRRRRRSRRPRESTSDSMLTSDWFAAIAASPSRVTTSA